MNIINQTPATDKITGRIEMTHGTSTGIRKVHFNGLTLKQAKAKIKRQLAKTGYDGVVDVRTIIIPLHGLSAPGSTLPIAIKFGRLSSSICTLGSDGVTLPCVVEYYDNDEGDVIRRMFYSMNDWFCGTPDETLYRNLMRDCGLGTDHIQ